MFRKTLGSTLTYLSTAFVLLFLCLPQAQSASMNGFTITKAPTVKKSSVFHTYTRVTPVRTIPLRDMKGINLPPALRNAMGNRSYTQQQIEQLRQKLIASGYIKPPKAPYTIPLGKLKPVGTNMPAVNTSKYRQYRIGQRLGYSSSYAFPGIGASDTPQDSIGCAPPDTNSAVGYDSAVGHDVVIEITNLCSSSVTPGVGAFKIWDATTGAVIQGTTSLGGLWSTSDCQQGGGDNNVNYDQFAQRWFMTQFNSSYTGVCLAVSVSSDPTGAYNLYDIVMDPNGFTDYPKVGKWVTGDPNVDSYMITANDFPPAACGNCTVFTAVQRSAVLAGTTAGVQTVIGPAYTTGLDFSTLPADVDGLNTAPTDAPGIFVDYISPWYYGGSTYALEMWQMSVNWTTPSVSLTGPTAFNVNPFQDGDITCAPQPSPGECLPLLGDRLMYRLAYRNGMGGDGHQVLLTNHTVTANGGSSAPVGIDWDELDAPAGSTDPTTWAITQQGLYAPSDGNSRWMGSIAMDHVGNIALGYTISGPSMDPSVAVTGQNVGAPSGTMDAPESILIAGTGVQENTGRWGDYSSIMPSGTDDCTFWTAQEYISNTGSFNWSTGNGNLKFSNCSIGPEGTVAGAVTDSSTNNVIVGAVVTLAPGGYSATTGNNGNYTMTVPVATYQATAAAFGYIPQTVSGVGVIQNQTTTENFALNPAPTATVSGSVADATPSGHTYGLYGEVKVSNPTFGQVADVWTDAHGEYSVNLPEGSDYTLNATAYLPGYNPGSATISNLSGNTTQDLGLTISSGCTAPGYQVTSGLAADFNGSFPPSGWTIVNDVDNTYTHWERNDSYGDNNFTGGTGFAAEANDDHGGSGLGAYSTQIISPPIDVSSLANANISWNENVQFLGTSELDFDISTDGGNTWITIFPQDLNTTGDCGTLYGTPGCSVSGSIASYLPSSGTFQLRWHFYNTDPNAWDWYTQIDDVLLGAGCAKVPGGLVTGRIRDANTRLGLTGATVSDSNTPSNTTKSITNSADSNLPTGWYWLFSNTNSADVITASDSGYSNASATLNVADDSITNQNLMLGAAQFVGTPGSYDLHVMVGTNSDQLFTIQNTGDGDGLASFETFNFAPPSGSQGQGAPLNQIHCSNLSPLSMVWLQNQKHGGYSPGCGIGNDNPNKSPPNAPAWTSITDYPGGIMDNAVATDEASGKVYSVGGVDGSGTTTAAGNVYDPNTQTWTAIAPLPSPSEKPASAFINGKLYVADGWDTSGNPTAALRIYDPSSNTWSSGANNPAPEGGGVGVAVLNNKMYLIGGCPTGSSCGDTVVEAYDPSTDTWTAPGALAAYPHQVSWEACGAVTGTLYCAGGISSSAYSDAYVYDTSANTWTAIAPIPESMWGGGYSGTSQGLLISGGIDNGSISNVGYIYTPGSNSWTPLPNSINSLYRGGSACGFYKVGGSLGGFQGQTGSELLAGYSPCGSGPIPWLGIMKNPKPVAAGTTGHDRFRFKGAGQTEFTTSQAYLMMGGTPYAPQQIDLTVHWDPRPVDLAVVPTANLSKLYAGGNLVFFVKLRNLSDAMGAASQVTLTYPLPAGVAYLSSYGDGTCSLASGTVTCTFPGSLPVAGRMDEQINVVPSIAGTLTSTFTVSAREPDLNYANNTASVTTTVLAVSRVTFDTITANHHSVTVGGQVTFNMGISNKGTANAKGVMVSVQLPPSLRFTGTNSGACSSKGDVVTCNLGQLTRGGKANVGITATAMRAGAATVTATITTSSHDSGGANHTGTVNVTVTPPSSMPPALR